MATELNVKLNNTLNGTSLKAIQDKNGNDIADAYLIKRSDRFTGPYFKRNVDNSLLHFMGGTEFETGASLVLRGKDNGGVFSLWAHDGSEHPVALEGYADGVLKWKSNDLASSAIVDKSLGTNGYIKYASGLIIQWGHVSLLHNTKTILTYSISFPTSCFAMNITPHGADKSATIECFPVNNKCEIFYKSLVDSTGRAGMYVAIGC